MPLPKWVPVVLDGEPLWVTEDVLAGETSGPLAPDAHITDGELNDASLFGLSYAHVFPDEIVRLGRVIGTRADLKPRNVEAKV